MLVKQKKYDVIVIGAGLSGLSAARAIHEAGKSVLVLEARNRVGGKTRSITTSSGGRLDLGGAWVNEHTMPLISGLVLESGGTLINQSVVGKASMELGPGCKLDYQDTGRIDQTIIPFEPADAENFLKLNMLLIELCSEIPTSHVEASKDPRIAQYDNITLEAWLDKPEVGAREHMKAALKAGVHALLGVEMNELPVSYLMHYAATAGGWLPLISNDESGAQYQRTRDGMQNISTYLASLLPQGSVILDSPIQKIEQPLHDSATEHDADQQSLVTVHTRSGEIYTARNVICTIPSPLYNTIVWSPPLPVPQQIIAQRAFGGILGKCIAVYDTPWWRNAGWSGTSQSSEGPLSIILDTCDGYLQDDKSTFSVTAIKDGVEPDSSKSRPHARQYSLTSFIAGKNVLHLFNDPKGLANRDQIVLAQLSRLFNNDTEVHHPTQLIFESWAEEEYSGGCPCPVLPAGVLSNYGGYYGERHGKVWFAGTEYSEVWKGYMEGAVHSGKEVAKLVLDHRE